MLRTSLLSESWSLLNGLTGGRDHFWSVSNGAAVSPQLQIHEARHGDGWDIQLPTWSISCVSRFKSSSKDDFAGCEGLPRNTGIATFVDFSSSTRLFLSVVGDAGGPLLRFSVASIERCGCVVGVSSAFERNDAEL